MHQETRVVFDEMINAEGGLTLYTGLLHTDFLRGAHQLGLQAVFMSSATSGSYIIHVQIEHSADGRNWLPKNTTAELSGSITLTPGVGVWSVIGGETWPPPPRLRFARLTINVTTRGVSPPASRLRVLATARTRIAAEGEPEEVVIPRTEPLRRREAMAYLLGMREVTLDEIEVRLNDVRPGDGLGPLTSRLSAAARRDLERVTRAFRSMDPAHRRAMLNFAGALASLAMLPSEESDNPSPPVVP